VSRSQTALARLAGVRYRICFGAFLRVLTPVATSLPTSASSIGGSSGKTAAWCT